ncbi:MAG: competence protein ComEC family protein [Clostridiales bacterium]|nr:competence protein ComEC family protein [Clostridiales bacterium]
MPQDTGSGYSYTVKTKSIDIDNAVQDVKVKLYSSSYIDADYYDEVSSYLNFYSFADNGFDSYGYFGEGIFIRAYTDYSDSEFDVNESKSKPPGYYFIRLREKIKSNTAYITSDGESALAYAVLTGDRSELSDEIISNFKICGATHITAVSGLHITMICLGIYYFFQTARHRQNILRCRNIYYADYIFGGCGFFKIRCPSEDYDLHFGSCSVF